MVKGNNTLGSLLWDDQNDERMGHFRRASGQILVIICPSFIKGVRYTELYQIVFTFQYAL